MCGIVGYTGKRQAYPIVIDGLKKLEYRGYDSAGIALQQDDQLTLYKKAGKVKDLEHFIGERSTDGLTAIGHTRWATHGEPSDHNAHPHLSQSGQLAMIHNGIIENYSELKEFLTEKGYKFLSQTDTEVIPNLIHYYYTKLNTHLLIKNYYVL